MSAAFLLALLTIGPTTVVASQQSSPAQEAPAAEDAESFDLTSWMTGFHKAPEPERVAWVIGEMARTGSWKKSGPMQCAFLAEVFRQHPERVAGWAQEIEGYRDEDVRHWLYLAVWWSGVPDSTGLLEAAIEREIESLAKTLRGYLEASPPASLRELPLNPERLDMLWASYFASGNPLYVERIADALDPEETDDEEAEVTCQLTRGAARWSLASNARQHEDVLSILLSLLTRAGGTTRTELEQIIEEAGEP